VRCCCTPAAPSTATPLPSFSCSCCPSAVALPGCPGRLRCMTGCVSLTTVCWWSWRPRTSSLWPTAGLRPLPAPLPASSLSAMANMPERHRGGAGCIEVSGACVLGAGVGGGEGCVQTGLVHWVRCCCATAMTSERPGRWGQQPNGGCLCCVT